MESNKRRKLTPSIGNSGEGEDPHQVVPISTLAGGQAPSSIDRAISPPPLRRRGSRPVQKFLLPKSVETVLLASEVDPRIVRQMDGETRDRVTHTQRLQHEQHVRDRPRFSSPFKLTRIRDLPKSHNIDTITLHDLLGDPLLQECWLFDYLFDIDFVMQHFDPDIRNLVNVTIVHGSWRQNDAHRLCLLEAVAQWPNVEQITAHMPEAFGTHHSKMMVLFRRDDTAQIVIHTANMIAQDWTNLTQGVWLSDRLPLLSTVEPVKHQSPGTEQRPPLGSGIKFKTDLLRYLSHYEGRTKSLRARLQHHDFSSIRAALIASVPTRQRVADIPKDDFAFGWPGLQHVLSQISCPQPDDPTDRAKTVVQISSVATLSPNWIENFTKILATSSENTTPARTTVFTASSLIKTRMQIIFPTTEEVCTSLDGYAAGASIHMRTLSAAQRKQLARLRPMLCRWGSQTPSAVLTERQETPRMSSNKTETKTKTKTENRNPQVQGNAQRTTAAPHIKTYIRFRDSSYKEIQWALLTSANLSTQAWGALHSLETGMNSNGRFSSASFSSAFASAPAPAPAPAAGQTQTVRISSYEIGVLIWPALFRARQTVDYDQEVPVLMTPVFGQDSFDEDLDANGGERGTGTVIVPLRMPYSLPTTPYAESDEPWCAMAGHRVPDRWGNTA